MTVRHLGSDASPFGRIPRARYGAVPRPGPLLRSGRARAAVVVGAALAMAAAFPPWDLWFLAPAGPAGLIVAVAGSRPRTGAALGMLFGTVFFGVLLTWLVNLGWAAWLVLTALQALFFAGLGAALIPLLRRRARLLALPAAWVALEAVRARQPLGGFPWGRLGFSQADAPTAGWVALGGIPLLGFLVALVGTALALAVLRVAAAPAPRLAARRGAASVAAAAALVLLGDSARAAAAAVVVHPPGVADRAVVAVVQGNVPRSRDLAEPKRAAQVTRNHVEATVALAARVRAGGVPAPDLVVWPENSTDVDPADSALVRDLLGQALTAIERPILVGAIVDADGGRRARNVGQLWVPDGRGGATPGARYVKRHLVPFGEYVPWRSLLGEVGDLTRVSRDFVPGTGPQVIDAGRVRIGDIICYEVAYDDEATDAVRAGANLLVVQSNNASYMRDGQVGETLQQLAMARLRAVENDRAVAVATTSGISAVVSPGGEVVSRTGTWQTQTLVETVDLRSTRTLASRVGQWPEAAIVAGAGLLPLLSARRRPPRAHA
ncbi:MAG: apolipoprotein N-acyltransferase [Sporichthyaceae bacterium]